MMTELLTCVTLVETILEVGEIPGDMFGEARTRDALDGGTSLEGKMCGTVSPSKALYTKYIAWEHSVIFICYRYIQTLEDVIKRS